MLNNIIINFKFKKPNPINFLIYILCGRAVLTLFGTEYILQPPLTNLYTYDIISP